MPLVLPIFKKHGLPTNVWRQTFWDSLVLHVSHLVAVNKSPHVNEKGHGHGHGHGHGEGGGVAALLVPVAVAGAAALWYF
jgi:hypothetical protein